MVHFTLRRYVYTTVVSFSRLRNLFILYQKTKGYLGMLRHALLIFKAEQFFFLSTNFHNVISFRSWSAFYFSVPSEFYIRPV